MGGRLSQPPEVTMIFASFSCEKTPGRMNKHHDNLRRIWSMMGLDELFWRYLWLFGLLSRIVFLRNL